MSLTRYLKCDMIKLKNTSLIRTHVILPMIGSVIYLIMIQALNASLESKALDFFGAIAEAMPIIIALICTKVINSEKNAGNYQFMLSSMNKIYPMISMLLVLFLLEFLAITGASIVFYALFQIIYHCSSISLSFYLQLSIFVVLLEQSLYLVHLFLSIRFNGTISIIYGIFQAFVALIMMSYLGDNIWFYIPCAWPLRMIQLLIYHMEDNNFVWILPYLPVFLLATGLLYVCYFIWYYFWEGSRIEE